MKRAFEKAYKQNSNSTDSEAKYSLEKTTDGIEYVKTEKDMFVKKDGTPLTEKEIFTSLIDKEIELSDGKLRIVNRLSDKYMYDELFKRRPYYKGVDDIKQLNSEINYNMKEVLSNSNLKKANVSDVDNKHIRQGIESFDTRTVNFYDGNKAYTLDLSIANLSDGEKIAYAKKMVKFNEELTKKQRSLKLWVKNPN